MNHRDKLLSRLKNQTSFPKMISESLKKQTSLKILECVDKRVFNKIHQKDVAEICKVGLSKIKAFEQLKVNDLQLYMNYIHLFEDMPNRKKREVPKWVYS